MQTVLICVQLLVSMALVVAVLLQKSEGGALGMGGGGGGMGGLFSPRGAADTLTQITVILGTLFFLTSMGLTLLALHTSGRAPSILDTTDNPSLPPHSAPASPLKPVLPAVPKPH